jgi:hypothetical protein
MIQKIKFILIFLIILIIGYNISFNYQNINIEKELHYLFGYSSTNSSNKNVINSENSLNSESSENGLNSDNENIINSDISKNVVENDYVHIPNNECMLTCMNSNDDEY